MSRSLAKKDTTFVFFPQGKELLRLGYRKNDIFFSSCALIIQLTDVRLMKWHRNISYLMTNQYLCIILRLIFDYNFMAHSWCLIINLVILYLTTLTQVICTKNVLYAIYWKKKNLKFKLREMKPSVKHDIYPHKTYLPHWS